MALGRMTIKPEQMQRGLRKQLTRLAELSRRTSGIEAKARDGKIRKITGWRSRDLVAIAGFVVGLGALTKGISETEKPRSLLIDGGVLAAAMATMSAAWKRDIDDKNIKFVIQQQRDSALTAAQAHVDAGRIHANPKTNAQIHNALTTRTHVAITDVNGELHIEPKPVTSR